MRFVTRFEIDLSLITNVEESTKTEIEVQTPFIILYALCTIGDTGINCSKIQPLYWLIEQNFVGKHIVW